MPDHGVRGPDYLLSKGITPYGWKGTPQNNQDARTLPGDYRALSESIDWGSFSQSFFGGSGNADQMSNPPFMGPGQTLSGSGSLPAWMLEHAWSVDETGKRTAGIGGQTKRILRGYIRRETMAKFANDAGTSYDGNELAAIRDWNTRLYFMYNPAEFTREYMSFGASQGVLDAMDVAGNQDIPAVQTTSVTFSLTFDRQIEVGQILNHPGVLLDLQVFDNMARNGQLGQTHWDGNQGRWVYEATDPEKIKMTSLTLNNNMLTVVLSPYLTFTGILISAGAKFEKFSHRMTPTRMTLELGLMLWKIGENAPPEQKDIVQEAQADAAKAEMDAAQAALLPTGASKDSLVGTNQAVKDKVVQWCRERIGCDYDSSPNGRMQGVKQDTIHQVAPNASFDCSSLIWRAFRVFGLVEALGWGTRDDSSAISTATIELQITKHQDAWDYKYTGKTELGGFHTQGRPIKSAEDLKPFLKAGDIMVRRQNGHGHVVIVASARPTDQGGPSGGSAGVTIIHAPGEDNGGTHQGKVKAEERSWQQCFDYYDFFASPHPAGGRVTSDQLNTTG